MALNFADDFVCDEELNALYSKVEKRVLPTLKRKAHRISSIIPSIDYEDALQDGKLAVLHALSKYNPEKSPTGGWEPYVGKVVVNAYKNMVYEALTQSRVPRVRDEDGILHIRHPFSLDGAYCKEGQLGSCNRYEPVDTSASQEDLMAWSQVKDDVRCFTMKMYNKLDELELEIFKCMVHPSEDLLEMMYLDGFEGVYKSDGLLSLEEGVQVTSAVIRKYLGITKNKIDWALYKIKGAFMRLAKYDDEFSDVFEGMLDGRKWPQVHVKKTLGDDYDWKKKIFRSRALDTAQVVSSESENSQLDDTGNSKYYRSIKWYNWGAVVVARRDDERVLMVVEGRFNKNTGAVFGTSGARLNVPMPWYATLVKELKNE